MKSMLPEAWISSNPSFRRLGFHEIQASGGLDFRKSKPPEAWIDEIQASGVMDFFKAFVGSVFEHPGASNFCFWPLQMQI